MPLVGAAAAVLAMSAYTMPGARVPHKLTARLVVDPKLETGPPFPISRLVADSLGTTRRPSSRELDSHHGPDPTIHDHKVTLAAAAEDSIPARQIQKLFHERCTECHGREVREADIDLSSFEALARTPRFSEFIVPGDAEQSLLWQVVRHGVMPPESPLPETEQAAVQKWIDQGTPGLRLAGSPPAERVRRPPNHWAFQPPQRPSLPSVRDREGIRTAVDQHIAATLEAAGLSLGPPASRTAQLRRLSFNLIGLPPDPAHVRGFLASPDPEAYYDRLVDHYLASPRYGERWGKFWLDAAGYAESEGRFFDSDLERRFAYLYRDYVIRSLNRDNPLDQFVREQLAGDELSRFEPGNDVTQQTFEAVVATQFLRNGQDGTSDSNHDNPLEVRADRYAVLESTLQITMSSLLGITIQCARCHDHKLEPISQREYYSLQAIFRPAFDPGNWATPEQRNLDFKLPGGQLLPVMGVVDMPGAPAQQHLLIRGRYDVPGPAVQPSVPAALTSSRNRFQVRPLEGSSGRRLSFARWITSPDNPLFARVMVNRIWQHHFGIGIVATAENFGRSGSPPTHPELLDLLATEFIRQGWSVKALHRLIVRSAVYRQSSAMRPEAAAVDPENRLLWRYPLRRLDAEAIRDAMLAVSGELDVTMYGPSVPTETAPSGEVVNDSSSRESLRRSIYIQQRRSEVHTMLATFDAPRMAVNCTQRSNSTTPSQSLFLLNSDFVRHCADALANRLPPEPKSRVEERIASLFWRALSRAPTVDELPITTGYVFEHHWPNSPAQERVNTVWIDLAHMILAGNAFLYLD